MALVIINHIIGGKDEISKITIKNNSVYEILGNALENSNKPSPSDSNQIK